MSEMFLNLVAAGFDQEPSHGQSGQCCERSANGKQCSFHDELSATHLNREQRR